MQCHLSILQSSTYITVSSYSDGGQKAPDQPVPMSRLISACVVLKLHKGPFRALHIIRKQYRLRLHCVSTQSDHDVRGPLHITKTCLYNTDPLKPHFYIVDMAFTGVYIIFSYFCLKHRLWVLVGTASLRRF